MPPPPAWCRQTYPYVVIFIFTYEYCSKALHCRPIFHIHTFFFDLGPISSWVAVNSHPEESSSSIYCCLSPSMDVLFICSSFRPYRGLNQPFTSDHISYVNFASRFSFCFQLDFDALNFLKEFMERIYER